MVSEKASFTLRSRNPDVLTCIANLSNDEVFTPPDFANQMLDRLTVTWAEDNNGENLWTNKNIRFLDPCTKSGVFLREITSRLTKGLAEEIPDLQSRVNHILTRQVFGIGITRLTSLLARRSVYCSKTATGEHSIANQFDSTDGNIWFQRVEHTWQNSSCVFCGTTKKILDRGNEFDTYAYAFIHTNNIKSRIKELFGDEMQFDVIVGNPPYQIADGGGTGSSARPIYQQFVEQAINLQPNYVLMVTPARWYAGGKGLNEFRKMMLESRHINTLVDFPTATDVFPGVDIAGGVSYFLWSRERTGPCEVINRRGEEQVKLVREMDEYPTFIRDNIAIPIVRKIHRAVAANRNRLDIRISPRKPFGLPSTYHPTKEGVPCWFSQRIGKSFAKPSDITDAGNALNKWKVLVPFAPIAGQTDFTKPVGFYYESNTRIASPGECCTETYLVAGAFSTKDEAENFKSYLFTKIVRFLLLQAVTSQNITRQYFYLIPDFESYDKKYTDDFLRKLWNINDSEWKVINERIA